MQAQCARVGTRDSVKELHRGLVADISPFEPAGTWGRLIRGVVVVRIESFETTGGSSFVDLRTRVGCEAVGIPMG